ncbi:hypothetical protein MHSWG343_06480 [Candidatus Mycoplasma haematohominis]|uniref:Uncharacterized protein n=1 Tax=Candidatus Mycoplasma haematohominis TaxID=1494318 RepID=A0A478FQ30_9MOLU|nr:hypothetical protein MHSWG343_06480 [Candidatus Mycoplasma haemohominis]
MDPTKLAAGIGATAVLIAGGGYGISALLADGMPDYIVLSKGEPTPTDSTIGKLYGNYLVAPYGSRGKTNISDETKSNSKKWWEWSYRRWEKDFKKGSQLSDAFKDDKKINSGFSDVTPEANKAKALNQVCEDVYKKTENDITPDTDNNKKRLRDDMWKYCSFFGRKPTTIKENANESYSTDGSYGKTKESELVSIDDPLNKLFWEIRNEEFFGTTSSEGIGAGLKVAEDSIFQPLYEDRFSANRGTIKNVCKEAYFLTSNETGTKKAKQDSVLKFCSLKGKENS